MTNPSPNVAGAVPGSVPATPQGSTAVARRVAKKPVLSSIVSRLKSLGGRGGEAVGDQYARLAGWLLEGVERFEDASAERRYLRRLKATKSSSAAVTNDTGRPDSSLPPAP